MAEFKQYRRKQIVELCAWDTEYDMTRVSVSLSDKEAGSPQPGDMIARNPKNHEDQWLVAAAYFADNFEPAELSVVEVRIDGQTNESCCFVGVSRSKLPGII